MATYDIDKITLPNGDVCNLYSTNADEDENLFVDGGPELSLARWFNGHSPFSWAVSTGGGILSSNNIEINPFEIKLSFTGPYTDTNAGITRTITRGDASNNFSTRTMGVFVDALHDGDDATFSFEYKSDIQFDTYPRLYARVVADGESLDVFDTSTPTTLNVSNTWSRVSFKGTVPNGWDDVIQALLEGQQINRCLLSIIVRPSAAGNVYIRKIKLNKGKIATNYTTDVLTKMSQCGGSCTYAASRDYTLMKNTGNIYGITATNRLFPVVGAKTANGSWVEGSCADKYQFVYVPDAIYNDVTSPSSAAEGGEVYSLPEPDNSISGVNHYDIWTTKQATTANATLSDNFTAASGITGVTAAICTWGKFAQLFLAVTSSSDITIQANGNISPDITLGTIADGKRPKMVFRGMGTGGSDDVIFFFEVNTSGTVKLVAANATGASRTVAANTNIILYGTYLLP